MSVVATNRGHRRYDPVICTRCQEPRWPYGGAQPADYICQRCRDTLAGVPNVVDPARERSPAQRAADALAAGRLAAHRAYRKLQPAPIRTPDAPAAVLALAPSLEAQRVVEHPRRPCRRHRSGAWTMACADCNPGVAHDPGTLPGDWKARRAQVLQHDGRRCRHCGTRERLSVHHVTPRLLGTHDPRNLITLCDACHDAVEQPAEVVS